MERWAQEDTGLVGDDLYGVVMTSPYLSCYEELAEHPAMPRFSSWFHDDVIELLVAVTERTVTGAQGIEGDLWAAHQDIVAWRELPSGSMQTQPGKLLWPYIYESPKELGGEVPDVRGLADVFVPDTILRTLVRRRKDMDERFQLLAVLPVAELAYDQVFPLREMLEELARPVEVATSYGTLLYDRRKKEFSGTVSRGKRPVDIAIDVDTTETITANTSDRHRLVAAGERRLKQVMSRPRWFDRRASSYAARKVLRAHNRDRRDDGGQHHSQA